jgi:hypothetical protein
VFTDDDDGQHVIVKAHLELKIYPVISEGEINNFCVFGFGLLVVMPRIGLYQNLVCEVSWPRGTCTKFQVNRTSGYKMCHANGQCNDRQVWPLRPWKFKVKSKTHVSYIKSCSHEVAKHKSVGGVICQFHLTVPPLATTLRKMVTQSVQMGNAHAGSLRNRRRPYTNPMSKFVSPKTFQSDKSAKNL